MRLHGTTVQIMSYARSVKDYDDRYIRAPGMDEDITRYTREGRAKTKAREGGGG